MQLIGRAAPIQAYEEIYEEDDDEEEEEEDVTPTTANVTAALEANMGGKPGCVSSVCSNPLLRISYVPVGTQERCVLLCVEQRVLLAA